MTMFGHCRNCCGNCLEWLQCFSCCRCVPIRACVTVTSGTEGCSCDSATTMFSASVSSDDVRWSGTIECEDLSIDLAFIIEKDGCNMYLESTCLGLTGSSRAIEPLGGIGKCLQAGDMVLFSVDGAGDCGDGNCDSLTITISSLPTVANPSACEACGCLCEDLCISYRLVDNSCAETVAATFDGTEWSASFNSCSESQIDVQIVLEEDGAGGCQLRLVTEEELAYDAINPVSVASCNGISVQWEFADGIGAISATCKNCECPPNVIPCEGACVSHGSTLVDCGVDAADLYLPTNGGTTSDPDLTLCCELPARVAYESGCLWSSTESGCDWEMEISGDTAEFRQIIDGSHTIIWRASNFDPLCPSLFLVDTDDSTIPEDCSYYPTLCLAPFNTCCDDGREEKIPDTLFARLTYCSGEQSNLEEDFEFTRDGDVWRASINVAGGMIDFVFSCNCVNLFRTGCGDTGNECYQLDWTKYAGCNSGDGTEVWQSCDCDPLDMVFLLELGVGCCSAGALQDWILEISEEAIP